MFVYRFLALFRSSASVKLGLLLALLVSGLGTAGHLASLEGFLLDNAFRVRGPREASPDIAVVVIDDATLAWARDKYGVGWPLPRRVYADLVEKLNEAGVRTVALDVLFAEPSHSPADDALLARACAGAANVVQAVAFQVPTDSRQSLPVGLSGGALPRKFAVSHMGVAPRRALSAAVPVPALLQSAAAVGHVNLFPEANGVLRRVPQFMQFRGATFPSLALAAAAHFEGENVATVLTRSRLSTSQQSPTSRGSLSTPHLALDRRGDMIVNWIGGNNSHPTFGATAILDNMDADVRAALKHKLVLVGVTAQGAYEHRATAFSSSQPAVEFQANASDALLTGRLLRTTPQYLVLAFTLSLTLFCAVITGRYGWNGAVASVLIGALLWMSSAFLLSQDIYLPVGGALLASVTTVAFSAALGFRREWEASARADASVLALARSATLLGATLSASGRDRERLISIIKATASETVGAREVFWVPANDEKSAPGNLAEEVGKPPHSPLEAVAFYAMRLGETLLWPSSMDTRDGMARQRKLRRVGIAGDGFSEEMASEQALFADAELWARGEAGWPQSGGNGAAASGHPTLLVAPLRRSHSAGKPGSEPGAIWPPPDTCYGALVVSGRKDGLPFSTRDAALLEALAEQATLAIENWEYSAMLRGRVEMANLDLRDAYGLLAEQSAKLFAAVDSIDSALVVADHKGMAAFVNPASGKILRGATPILGETVSTALAHGDLEELAVLFESMRLQGAGALPTRAETTRGSEILSVQVTPLISDGDELLGAMLVVTDVTAQRELDRMKTDFVGFVAHELRNPLTTILGYASLMDQNAGSLREEQVREMTTVIARHCRRMNRLITDLLDISRVEAGQELSIHAKPFHLDQLCQEMVLETRSQINPCPPLEVLFEGPEAQVIIWGDQERVEQVLANLLSNAVKYSPEGGRITVRLETREKHILLKVSDTGMGMTAEQVERLFSKFYRTPDAFARGIKGTGLGLFLVRQLVQAHGGSIQVQSAPGLGTTFEILLPVNLPLR